MILVVFPGAIRSLVVSVLELVDLREVGGSDHVLPLVGLLALHPDRVDPVPVPVTPPPVGLAQSLRPRVTQSSLCGQVGLGIRAH